MDENNKGKLFIIFIIGISLVYTIIKNWETIVNDPKLIIKYIGILIGIILLIVLYIFVYKKFDTDNGLDQFPIWLKLLLVLIITVVLGLIGYFMYKNETDFKSKYFKLIFILLISFLLINYLDGGLAMYITAIITVLTFMLTWMTKKLYETNCENSNLNDEIDKLYNVMVFIGIYFMIQNNKIYEAIILISLLFAYYNYESETTFKTVSVLFLLFSLLKLLFPTLSIGHLFDNKFTTKLLNKFSKFVFLSFIIINIMYSLHVPTFAYYIILPIIFILLMIF